MATYRIISYGVLGNARDGWEVNDAHLTVHTVELDDEATRKQIVAALKKIGWIGPRIHAKSVGIDWDGGDSIYISDARMGRGDKPEFELRKDV